MSILEKIFDGEFEPVNGRRPQSPEYGELNKQMTAETEHWEKTMSADDFARLEVLIDTIAGMGRHECFETFKIGIALATEVISMQRQVEKEEGEE